MLRSDPSPFDRLPPSARGAFVSGIVLLYGLAFVSLYPALKGTVAMLSLIPTAASGWLLGLRAGLLAGLLVSLVNFVLFPFFTGLGWDLLVQGVPANTVFTAIGIAVGWRTELLRHFRRQSRELARDREILREEIAQRVRAEAALSARARQH